MSKPGTRCRICGSNDYLEPLDTFPVFLPQSRKEITMCVACCGELLSEIFENHLILDEICTEIIKNKMYEKATEMPSDYEGGEQ